MESPAGLPQLREALIFFGCAGLVIPLLQRLRVSPVLGFLVVGTLIGPFGLGLLVEEHPWLRYVVISDIEGVRSLAQLGVILLLFIIGLELSVERLVAMHRMVFGAGLLQVAISALIIGGVAAGFGNALAASIVLGLSLSLSSTAVVVQLLVERRELATPLGRASFAVLLFQDLAVVPLLLLVSILGAGAGAELAQRMGFALLKALLAVGAIVLIGRSVLRPLFRRVAALRQPEAFMALTLLLVIGTALTTASAGLSMALGAFLAGLIVAETEYRHEVEVNIEPFKGLLMGLFFLSVGMATDLRVLQQDPAWIVASVAGLFLIKAAVVAPILRAFGLSLGAAAHAGLLLGGGGEFAFIAVTAAMTAGLLEREVAQFMLIVVGFSLLATPLAAQLGRFAGRHLDRVLGLPAAAAAAEIPPAMEGHVIIAGFGRVGQLLARVLDANQVPFLALDTDAELVERLRRARLPVYFGDASRGEILDKAGAERAAAVVITLDQTDAARRAAHAVRRHFPEVPLVARARDEAHAALLRQAGARGVVPETLEAGLQLSGHVLEALGIPPEARDEIIDRQRELELAGQAGRH
jgi:CPA2 family monovalent cation:H+ antiporter-2